jgi:hypothetical protein
VLSPTAPTLSACNWPTFATSWLAFCLVLLLTLAGMMMKVMTAN